MRPYRYAGAPPRRRPINEDELVRDLHRVCRYVLGKHPVKHAPPSRVKHAARMVLRYGSPGELTAVLYWLARSPRRLPVRVGASAWALGETGEPFEYLVRHLDYFTRRLQCTGTRYRHRTGTRYRHRPRNPLTHHHQRRTHT